MKRHRQFVIGAPTFGAGTPTLLACSSDVHFWCQPRRSSPRPAAPHGHELAFATSFGINRWKAD